MENELGELEEQEPKNVVGQKALERRRKRELEEKRRKENAARIRALKKGKKKPSAINRDNLNPNFFVNAKKNTDEVAGWAFEFDKNEVQVAAGGNPPMGAPLARSDPGQKPESESPSTSSIQTEEAAAARTVASVEEHPPAEPSAPEEHKSRKEWETFVREKDAELAEKYTEDGRFVYELYSVMVHSGSAHGGHYYAYIKDFETGKWHEFNDSRVSEKSVLDILGVFG